MVYKERHDLLPVRPARAGRQDTEAQCQICPDAPKTPFKTGRECHVIGAKPGVARGLAISPPQGAWGDTHTPCKSLALYFHNIMFDVLDTNSLVQAPSFDLIKTNDYSSEFAF